MSGLGRNISLALRAERLIARRRLSVMRTQTGLVAAAAVAGAIGYIAVNSAAFFLLTPELTAAGAALVIAFANFGLCGVMLTMANRVNADTEVEAAVELRDMAMAEIEADLNKMAGGLSQLGGTVRAASKDPLGALAPHLASGVVTALLKARKSGKDQDRPRS